MLGEGPRPQGTRAVSLCHPDGAAVVLGSTQSTSDLDRAALATAGLASFRRRSGGGAVLLMPSEVCWIEVSIPKDDPLWHDDVGRSMWWLGEVWAAALAPLLDSEARVHRGPPVRSEWSARACFAGVGSGEVTVGGRKVVGLSQRRTRNGSLFQCAAPLRLHAGALAAVAALSADRRSALRAELDRTSWGLQEAAASGGAEPVTVGTIEAAFVTALMDTTG